MLALKSLHYHPFDILAKKLIQFHINSVGEAAVVVMAPPRGVRRLLCLAVWRKATKIVEVTSSTRKYHCADGMKVRRVRRRRCR